VLDLITLVYVQGIVFGRLTSLGQHPLVVDNRDILLGKVDDLVVLDLP